MLRKVRKISECCQDSVIFRPAPHDMKQNRIILMQIQIACKQKNKLYTSFIMK